MSSWIRNNLAKKSEPKILHSDLKLIRVTTKSCSYEQQGRI